MSSDNPPYPYYNGIPFNPSFFTSDTGTGSGLSETAANALYLRKTTPDTATALETFNGGITTPSVSSTGALSIGASNNSITNIASGNGISVLDATGAVNIKTGNNNTGTISIGKFTNATNQTTTTISGAANISTTGGIVAIATGSARNTNISIGTGSNGGSQGSVDINTGALSAGQTSINNGFNATGAIAIGSATNVTQTCYLNSGQIAIGTVAPSTNTRNITIGASDSGFNSNTALNGNTTVLGTTNINTSGGQFTNIGSASGSSITTILGPTNINTSGSSTTNIGNSEGLVTLDSSVVNINTLTGSNTTIGKTGSGTTSLNNPTINLGKTGTALTIKGTTNLNTANTDAGVITIGNIALGSTNLNSSLTNINTIAPTDNLKTTTIGATNVGFDTNTNINGKTTISKLATPLTPIYAYPVAGENQIGYTVRVNVGVDVAIPTAQTTIVTLPSVNSGKWLISFLMCIKGGGANNIGVNSILYKDTVAQTYSVTAVGPTSINTSNNIVITDDIAVGSTAVYSIKTNCNQAHTTSSTFTATAPAASIANAGYLQATRIA